eukprot:scaffold6286_cov48-Cyclotella_meneghiniana.AAC.7
MIRNRFRHIKRHFHNTRKAESIIGYFGSLSESIFVIYLAINRQITHTTLCFFAIYYTAAFTKHSSILSSNVQLQHFSHVLTTSDIFDIVDLHLPRT